jgi:hypothetical protein
LYEGRRLVNKAVMELMNYASRFRSSTVVMERPLW